MSLPGNYWDELAASEIDNGIREAAGPGRVIDSSTARLISACLHDNVRSALGRFAGTGRLDRRKVMLELLDIEVPEEHEGWEDALWSYLRDSDPQLLQARRKEPV